MTEDCFRENDPAGSCDMNMEPDDAEVSDTATAIRKNRLE